MSASKVRSISDVSELLALAKFSEVTYYELSGQRTEAPEQATPEAPPGEEEGGAPLQVLLRHDAERIQVRVRCEAEGQGAQYVADVAAEFALAEPVDAPAAVLREFVERVGVMAVYPFVREALHTTASRLRMQAPLLQLLRANQVDLIPDQDDEGNAPASLSPGELGSSTS